jgi:hypothetical protein
MQTDRAWAVGLDQDTFTHEYLQRYPFADVIPNGQEWAKGSDPVYHGISGVMPDTYQIADGPVKAVDVTPKKYVCRGCGREFGHHLGRTAHERACKVKIAAGGA